MDREDRELLERSLRHATDRHRGAELDAALDEVGWSDAVSVDPRAAVSTLFELQGAANATSSAIDVVLLGILGGEAGAVVLPPLGRWSAPGSETAVRGLGTAALATAGTAVVVTGADGTGKDVAVVVETSALELQPVRGLDPDLGLVDVTGPPVAGDTTVDWQAAVTVAQLALSHELIGAARTMVELARTHALERVQFGRPIASFQAVRHRLAEALIAIEAAQAVVDAAWEDQSPHTAAIAKALAGRGARAAGRHCQQVLAGIGFTTEHPFHRYLRRVLVLDELFGSARGLTKALGEELIATRHPPAQLPL